MANGEPMHPAPIVMADRTWKKSAKHNLNIIGAPIHPAPIVLAHRSPLRHYNGAPNTKNLQTYLNSAKRGGPNSSVRLAYFQANRL